MKFEQVKYLLSVNEKEAIINKLGYLVNFIDFTIIRNKLEFEQSAIVVKDFQPDFRYERIPTTLFGFVENGIINNFNIGEDPNLIRRNTTVKTDRVAVICSDNINGKKKQTVFIYIKSKSIAA